MPSRWRRALRRASMRFRSSSRSQQDTFTEIFKNNVWADPESVSGPGSSQQRAADFQGGLLELLHRYDIRSIVDAPCGDFNWMRNVLAEIDVEYTGIDIVAPLIGANVRNFASANHRFLCADFTRAELPRADLILCRDGLVHLSFADAGAAVSNFRRSGSRYLLATTFVERTRNTDIPTGGWRPLNMEAAPFNFPPLTASIDERCTHSGGIYRDKRLGLWELVRLG